jgi:hypothetical protein
MVVEPPVELRFAGKRILAQPALIGSFRTAN